MKTLITIALLTTSLFTANAQGFGNQQKLSCITISNGSDLDSIGSEGSGVSSIGSEGSGVNSIGSEGSGVQTICQINTI